MSTRTVREGGHGLLALTCLLLASGCASAPANPVAKSSAFGTSTLESHDVRLAEALLKVRSKRTPEHLVAAGDRYAQLGVRDTAMDYYSASLAIDPRYAPALDGAARIWRDWGQFGPALGDASRATYFAPRSPEAWNTLGTVLQVLGEMEGAAAAYRKSVTLDSSAAYARSNLCYLSFLQGHTAEARDACSAAVDADGQFVQARNNLTLIHAAAGDTSAAFEAFQTAGGEAVAHYNLGIVLLAERRYEEAVRAFEAAYRLDPSFDRAHGRARHARRQALAARESTHGRR